MPTALSLQSFSPGKLLESLGLAQGNTFPLEAPFEAQRTTVESIHGTLALYSDRTAQGNPVLLIHSVNAAASSYEMKPLFEAYAGRRPVHALDLPGFGLSGRDDRTYDPALFAGAIGDVLRHIAVEGHPADIIALSLGAEFAVRAALESPELVRSLVLISPTGLGAVKRKAAKKASSPSRLARAAHDLLTRTPAGDALFTLLSTRPVLRHLLAKSFKGQVDQGLLDYDVATTHQQGAKHAPLEFISGSLFTPDAYGELYARLTHPALVLYDRDAHTSFERLSELQGQRSNWQAARIPGTRGMPHFERPDETRNQIDVFFQTVTPGRFPLALRPSLRFAFLLFPFFLFSGGSHVTPSRTHLACG